MRSRPRPTEGKLRATLLILLTISTMMAVFDHLEVRASNWTSATQVPANICYVFNIQVNCCDTWPGVSRDPLGRVWRAFGEKVEGSFNQPKIFFKMLSNGTWTNKQQVTNDLYTDDNPFVTQLSNGSMMLLWSSNRTGSGQYEIFYKFYSGTSRNPFATIADTQLTNNPLNDTQPSAIQDRNGRIWVVWARQSQTSAAGLSLYYSDIYYKYFNGTTWSADFPLPQASNIIVNGNHMTERMPHVRQTKDGRIWILWSSNETADGTFDVNSVTTDGTVSVLPATGIPAGSWSARRDLCCSDNNAEDDHPVLVQDRSGTLDLFWERCAGSGCNFNIYYMNSTNNGVTWSTPTAVPAANPLLDERFPVAGQMSDNRVYLFWQVSASNTTAFTYTTSDPIVGISDVGIYNLTASPMFIRSGDSITVNAGIANYGDSKANTTLTVRLTNTAGTTIINTTPIVNLASGSRLSVKFVYATISPFWGRYNLTATLSAVPGENTINQGDNFWSIANERISPPGDVNFDGCITILDAALLAYAYGSTAGPPPSPRWDPNSDINKDGAITLIDAATLAFYYTDCV